MDKPTERVYGLNLSRMETMQLLRVRGQVMISNSMSIGAAYGRDESVLYQ